MSEPGAVATGSEIQRESQHSTVSVARFAGLATFGTWSRVALAALRSPGAKLCRRSAAYWRRHPRRLFAELAL